MTDLFVRRWMADQQRAGHSLCLILDSENESDIRQSLLNASPIEQYLSVYEGTAITDLANAGPFIFTLDQPGDRRIDGLLEHPQRNWGWLASLPKGDLPNLAKHWRERLLIGPRAHQALYRFHDNRVLARALEQLPADALPAYLGPVISVCCWDGTGWKITDNPAPGTYPVPNEPLWLRTSTCAWQAMQIRLINAHRYLLAEHVKAYADLAGQHDPDAWLRDRLTQADAWGWHAPEQVEFLLVQSLQAPAYTLEAYWQARADETPARHFERVYSLQGLGKRQTPL
ncbi:uncharacterized protein DUF4123 [Pseudomonas sp. WPR_5_2]|uniref:DUF4123 domain-containing protein n=1 Tax=Pseudomonas sp. WPR_5_2 TaxID=1907371 RepID=UPI000EB23DB8|nr:DUF4123 domain-containing protein [Pseudomonas sp. WPR_5_2]RKS12592.1 uncharacterized protein DUF4123 [Pseudomonas sp. WPR_5_2]